MWQAALADLAHPSPDGATEPGPDGADGRGGWEDGVFAYADLEMDLAAMKVRRGGAFVHLAPTEFNLLRHFLRHPERAFTRDQLVALIRAGDDGFDRRNVDAHIVRLRRALNRGGRPDLIRTIRRHGYSLDASCS